MSTISDECELFFYEEITPLKENTQFWLVRHKQTGKYFVKKKLSSAHWEVYHALMGINSQNMPRIYECISLDNECVVIEEYINGDTLADLKEQGKISHDDTIKIMIDICNVLFILHSMNPPIVHRDIKPENIMLTNDGIVKLMDFDIARVYDKGKNQDTEYMGTVGYAAPEHFGFGQTDAKSDIYSCGVLLNFLLTGKMPGEQMVQGQMGRIVEKCIQINPVNRYQNVFELRSALTHDYGSGMQVGSVSQTHVQMGNVLGKHAQTENISQEYMQTENVSAEHVQTGNISQKYQDTVYARRWQRFLLPGFRTLTPWKMLVALFSYALIIDVAASLEPEDMRTGIELLLNRIFSGIGMFSSVFVLFNYLGIADQLPGTRRADGSISWGKRWLYAFASFVMVVCALVLVTEFIY